MRENGNILKVNGKEFPYSPGMTVATLLGAVQTGENSVVVELNAVIIPRERFRETPLNLGDVVEIVHFVGGG